MEQNKYVPDEDGFIHLAAECFSNKQDNSLGFEFTAEADNLNEYLTDAWWIDVGIRDSFWELYFEFEPGAEKAKQLFAEGKCSDFKSALTEVFGHFELRYKVNGKEEDLSFEIDPDEIMYDLLLGTYGM